MKEIIKQGKTEKYIHICNRCGCVFIYEPSDLVGFRSVENAIVDCPCCKTKQSTAKDTLYEKTSEQETPRHTSCENASVSQIARMQQQIDTFKAALLHINERINNGNKCNLVYTEPLDDNDKHFINNIIKFVNEHIQEHTLKNTDETATENRKEETTVFDVYPQIKQSNAINIVTKTPIDDFTTDQEAELNEDDLDDIAKILAKNRKHGYVTVSPTNKDSLFRRTFIEPNLNEKGFLRQDRFATELISEDGFLKYMLFFPWCKADNQNAPYNEK